MRLTRRKSTLERVLEGVTAAASIETVRRTSKWALGVVGGAATATAVSAAVSSARQRGQR
jgi:hypothetical protein